MSGPGEADCPPFGKPWAADGETRPSRFRTPVAFLQNLHDSPAILFVQDPNHDSLAVMTLANWLEWVKDANAKPVPPPE